MPAHTNTTDLLTGRCYCGETALKIDALPVTIAYCHCTDCRRVTGAPIAAFVAFDAATNLFSPPLADPYTKNGSVNRWSCRTCASPLAATFSYLPDYVYVPVGIFDAPDRLEPMLHCHTDAQLAWSHVADDLPKIPGSASANLLNRTQHQ